MDLLNALIVTAGVCVTGLVAWSYTRTTRARYRAREAQIATQLLSARGKEQHPVTPEIRQARQRLEHTARRATTEFTRLVLDDGPPWWPLVPVGAYGAMLVGAVPFASSAGAEAVYIVGAATCTIYTASALWIKHRRTQRLKSAAS
ncbi:hypothetical protein [uncultured Microbacterium sp.]|uniref:hypothetical protein n=1 Tax=uncultured Microbacterium sp. TaxID=191216 RepID=UPI00261D8131|nr:hypothetical protein [uncultured Microbacterium sp.]